MVVKTIENGFQVHKSDANLFIRKVGTNEEYSVAVDLLTKEVEYEETDKEIPPTPKPLKPEENV